MRTFWAAHAWVGAWRRGVTLTAEHGVWSEIAIDTQPTPDAILLGGPAIPGMVNAHSHAFQRAFAGLAERRHAERDDFWTWRDRMYRVAGALDPHEMRIVARQLFCELLLGGYTQLCEFHYLHRRADGTDHADAQAMMHALITAAEEAGLGLTMIPVIYERAGFDLPQLRDDQRPFRLCAAEAWEAYASVRPTLTLNAAVGVHSLRAVQPESIRELLQLAARYRGPLHIHVAEQIGEVEACLAATGARPIEWLAEEKLLDERWQLVHATHATDAELDAIAASGAGVVLCPGTEANLGDGIAAMPDMLCRGIPVAIGSDSQIERSFCGELRMLENAQRLKHRQRCVAAAPESGMLSTGERLLAATLQGGARAAGLTKWGITPGARADLVVLNLDTPAMWGIPLNSWLDAAVFSSPADVIRDVLVAGQFIVTNGVHPLLRGNRRDFEFIMNRLWG